MTTNLSLIDRAIAGALETLATQADTALRASTEPSDRAYARRELNAANKALSFFLAGTRPVETPDGAWLVTSATQAGTVYRVDTLGCSCPAGIAGASCWHATLITATIMGYDSVELVEEYTPDDSDPLDIAGRICAARALLLAA